MRALLVAVVFSVLGFTTSQAHAGVNSLVAVGVNTAFSMRQNNTENADTQERTFVNSFGLQLKLLRGIAFELNYAPIGMSSQDPQQTRFDNPLTASGLIYIVPLTPVAGYLKGGVGNTGFGTLFRVGNETATYHAGAGLEVHLTKHVVLGTEFLWLIPGASQVVSGVANDNRSASYYVTPSNFRASFRASWYF